MFQQLTSILAIGITAHIVIRPQATVPTFDARYEAPSSLRPPSKGTLFTLHVRASPTSRVHTACPVEFGELSEVPFFPPIKQVVISGMATPEIFPRWRRQEYRLVTVQGLTVQLLH